MESKAVLIITDYLFRLVSEATLSFGFVEGTGLGAPLLAWVAAKFLQSRGLDVSKLPSLIRAWRGASSKSSD